ncbi:MAG: SMC-Scp complex subunit ScpB, partial [Candidatus Acidiferrales bacterium]
KDFLLRFGLNDVDDLPSLKEFEQLAKAALGADDGVAFSESAPEADAELRDSVEELRSRRVEESSEPTN